MQLWCRPLKPAELALMRGHQWNGRWDEWYEMEEMGWGWLCTGAQITIEYVKDKLCLAGPIPEKDFKFKSTLAGTHIYILSSV